MKPLTLQRLVKLSRLALDDCRRKLASAERAVAALDASVKGTVAGRRELLAAPFVVSPSATADGVAVLDARGVRLEVERGAADGAREAARGRVVEALRRSRTLERLAELRNAEARKDGERKDERAAGELATVLRFHAARKQEDEHAN